jgi:hypothetical protein
MRQIPVLSNVAKLTIVQRLWEAGICPGEKELYIHEFAPKAPAFPLCRKINEARMTLGDPLGFLLEEFMHILEIKQDEYRVLFFNLLGTFDRFVEEYGMNDGKGNDVVLIDLFLTNSSMIGLCLMEYGTVDDRTHIFTLVDCEFSGFDELRTHGIEISSLMTFSEFLSLSVEGGFLTQRRSAKIKRQLLRLQDSLTSTQQT